MKGGGSADWPDQRSRPGTRRRLPRRPQCRYAPLPITGQDSKARRGFERLARDRAFQRIDARQRRALVHQPGNEVFDRPGLPRSRISTPAPSLRTSPDRPQSRARRHTVGRKPTPAPGRARVSIQRSRGTGILDKFALGTIIAPIASRFTDRPFEMTYPYSPSRNGARTLRKLTILGAAFVCSGLCTSAAKPTPVEPPVVQRHRRSDSTDWPPWPGRRP